MKTAPHLCGLLQAGNFRVHTREVVRLHFLAHGRELLCDGKPTDCDLGSGRRRVVATPPPYTAPSSPPPRVLQYVRAMSLSSVAMASSACFSKMLRACTSGARVVGWGGHEFRQWRSWRPPTHLLGLPQPAIQSFQKGQVDEPVLHQSLTTARESIPQPCPAWPEKQERGRGLASVSLVPTWTRKLRQKRRSLTTSETLMLLSPASAACVKCIRERQSWYHPIPRPLPRLHTLMRRSMAR
jgi:hypothetical protein